MKTAQIMVMLRTAIFTGAIAILPAAAMAENTQPPGTPTYGIVPDHQEAEARAPEGTTIPAAETAHDVPTHAEAEDRGRGAVTLTGAEEKPGVPDHQEAEDRGAKPPQGE